MLPEDRLWLLGNPEGTVDNKIIDQGAKPHHPQLRKLRSALIRGYEPKPRIIEQFTPRDPEGNALARALEDGGQPIDPRQGAVLVLLYVKNDTPVLPLMRRTELVEYHKGEISLPGGAVEPEDRSLMDTASRETFEELGVASREFTIWGPLAPVYIPHSHFVVSPFVAYAPLPPAMTADPFEVAEILEVPLATLLDPATVREEVWEWPGGTVRAAFFQYGPHRIWGATARVLSQLVDILS